VSYAILINYATLLTNSDNHQPFSVYRKSSGW